MRHRSLFLGILVFATLLSPAVGAAEQDEVTWLGVQLGRAGGASPDGVPVFRVIEGSPADKGGLRARDTITAVDGHAVMDNSELIERIQAHDTGSWIALTVDRSGHGRDLRVRLTARPENEKMKPRTGWIGVRAIALPPELREHFGAPKDAGVMISRIDDGSPAHSAGFELGDVLYEMDGRPVRNPAELYKMLAGAGVGNETEFLAMRWGLKVVLESTIETAPDAGARP